MGEYIEREAAIAALIEFRGDQTVSKYATVMQYKAARDAISRATKVLESLPAADVEPVKHGMWIAKQTALGTKYTVCSNCGYGISIPLDGHLSKLDLSDVPRCPNCGEKMDLEVYT